MKRIRNLEIYYTFTVCDDNEALEGFPLRFESVGGEPLEVGFDSNTQTAAEAVA